MKKVLVVILAAAFVFILFYPNRLNRYIQRRIRFYKTAPSGLLEDVMFQKIALGNTVQGQYTSLVIGPDNKLYAGAIDGKIKRFVIRPNGDLSLEHIFKPFGEESKLTIGLAFDPASTADSLIVWNTYSETNSSWASFHNAEQEIDKSKWAGSMNRLQLDAKTDRILESEHILKGLPCFGPNHENFPNSIVFGPDGMLYFAQGANTGMGWCDCEENQEPSREALLSGALLCLDTGKLPSILPIDVKTYDGGGSYDPYDKEKPLSIYATGIRNAYDIVWHSNGQLYATVNSSGGNENTPTSDQQSPYYIRPFSKIKYTGPNNIPAVFGAQPDQDDFMVRVEKGGYYGHPNPLRAEYVLNNGDEDLENSEYNGVKPDTNFRGFAYDFGPHMAPTGILEYTRETFGGRLKGCLIVALMGHKDLVILRPGGEKKDIIQDYDGTKMGLTLDTSPLDLVEDKNTGNIYVSEYGKRTITLFHPIENGVRKAVLVYDENTSNKIKDPLEDGKIIYQHNCQMCHGVKGIGAMAPSLVDMEWIYGIDSIFSVIQNGSDSGSMPAWKDKFSKEEIISVESYILSLVKKEI
ncbi:c-type cytochrome [Zobellia barbeyronii]|uniref:C-type cytochrome n=1 Tax=Zobellia barbeyronii TaxID=2748009 RepID=A0ABS5W9P1_9FLAO|nr:c-type cytochrome [Zobellia barbeyronii]MBT2159755.1 c-type cytochrome [Zobellia barbeyronii]